MKIGVPREIHAGERRVATTPDVAAQLIKLGFDVAVEKDAGAAANYSDDSYIAAGCEIVAAADDIWSQSDLILKVRAPEDEESGKLRSGQMLISFLWPGQNPELLKQLTDGGVTAMAMAENGCIELDGQHCGLSSRGRGSTALRTVLHWADYRCR